MTRQTKQTRQTYLQPEYLNHLEAEDGNISHTEEAQGDTDRVGVANDRLSEKSQ